MARLSRGDRGRLAMQRSCLNPGSKEWMSLVLAIHLVLVTVASAARVVVVEDWMANRLSQRGIPSGWTGEGFGRRADYDFTIEQAGEARVLHLKSSDEHSTIVRDITGKVQIGRAHV